MPNVPVPRTWVDQDAFTAPVANTELRDIQNFLLAPPRVALGRIATLSMPTSGSDVIVPWDTEYIDPFGMWTSSAPTRITTQVPGKYRVSIVGSFSANATGLRAMKVRLNGATPLYTVSQIQAVNSATTGTVASSSLVLPYTFAIGEYFELLVVQTTGGSISFSGTNDSYLTAEWMGS